ncbi:MAG: 1-acyl-sn-glycerol-3-phosphate acyltransferase [Oscillospiraceae bacterium]|nr:1-acyl-sn-glycerol-3-phosphate acyltransferase [Oscillospiraceae bacterium]
MSEKKISWFSRCVFKAARWLVRSFYGKCEVEGLENLPKENAVIVANHTQMNGPICGELFMPDNCYIWCAGQMMNLKEVPQYAYTDFWSQKPKWTRPFFKLLSYIIAPLASCIFNNARTIAVYRDSRIISTFRETVKMLSVGRNILVFPEKDEKHNNILYKFQENFIDVAKLYYKKTGTPLTFVPMYIAPALRKMYIGKGITFDSNNDIADERCRIADYLSDEITTIARDLPRHTVVPYRNIKKKYYLTNKDVTEVPNEKTYG